MTLIEILREIVKSPEWASHAGAPVPDTTLSAEIEGEQRNIRRSSLAPGMVIEWQSPLFFGPQQGEVIEVRPSEVLVWHPRKNGMAAIETAWVTHIIREGGAL